MDAAGSETTETRTKRHTLRHTLAGLEAGVLGALFMILWSMAASVWHHRSIWAIPNLYATTFYGSRAYTSQFLRSSWSGLALMLVICGLGGMIWGLLGGWISKDGRTPFLTLFGGMAGVFLYYILFDLIWRQVNPLLPLYAPEPQIQIGYLIWGITLARSPGYSRRMASPNPGEPQDIEPHDTDGIEAGATR